MTSNKRANIDKTDLAILSALQTDGRITNAELAARVNLSASACLRRVQRLERDGVIAGYAAQLDAQALGLGLQAFVRVQLKQHDTATVEAFASAVNAWNEVATCHALTGDMDYLLHVYVADLEHFSHFLLDQLLNTGGVADVNSSFVLRTVKQTVSVPVGGASDV
ncbi:MAG TPA: Lrp/AsnC family transcriptional regulator [Rhodanobacteraceae bacterium]